MTTTPTHVLLVEDSPLDATFVRKMLGDAADVQLQQVDRLASALEHLAAHETQVVLLDLGLPDSQGLDTLRAVTRAAPQVAVVVLTGDDEETGRAAVHEGAQDYLAKGQFGGALLRRAIRQAQERQAILVHSQHLNRMLHSVRGVNQLIVREKNPRQLITWACELLVEERGYRGAWMALARNGGPPWALASAGFDQTFAPLAGAMNEGRWPVCRDRVRAEPTGMVVLDPTTQCKDCPLACGGGLRATVVLRHGPTHFGVLGVAMAPGFDLDRGLLRELGADLAFALHSLELEVRRQESEALFRVSFEKAAVGQVLTSLDGRFLQVNAAMATLLEFTEEELEEKSVAEITHPEDVRGSINTLQALLAGTADTVRLEKRYLCKSGRVVWGDVGFALLSDAAGRPQHFIGTIVDVTARKEAELGRQRALEELNALLAATRVVLNEPDVTAATRRIFDLCRGLVGAEAGHVVLTDDAWQEKQLVVFDASGLPPDAPMDSVLSTPMRFDAATVGVLGLASKPGGFTERDADLAAAFAELIALTLRNALQAASLRGSEERYRTLVENLDDLVFSLDARGQITYASTAICRYGYQPEQVLGKPFDDFVHPEDLAGVSASFARTLGGHVEPYEFRLIDKAGGVRFVRSSSRAVRVDGESTGLTGVLIDLTAQRAIEDQLRMAVKMDAVGRLAGGVAHDFNNLLSVILNYAGFARDQVPPGSPLRDDLEEIRKAAQRAADLTRQLLAFSRKQQLRPASLDLNTIIAEMEKMLRRLIREDVTLEVRPAAGLWRVRADRGQIDQVLMNFAVNARDAMPDGGKLTIETSNVMLDEKFVRSHVGASPGPHVMVAVTDTGIGMDRATLGRLFEPFFTTKVVGRGTGLGLATTYGIVKQSGASIWVKSEVGRGTTFMVYLPRTTRSPEAVAPAPRTSRPGGAGGIVLVVDDEEGIRQVSRRVLTTAGYDVFVAANGGEALELCEKLNQSPVLLLTDMVMPGMNGRELARQLLQRFPALKVLLTSGYTDEVVVSQGNVDASVGFIGKPFTAEDLTRQVREALGEDMALDTAPDLGTGDGATGGEGHGDLVEAAVTDAVRSLPAELVAELRSAVVAARHDQVLALLNDLEATAPEIAVALRREVMDFDYGRALMLLDRGGSP